MWYRLVKSQVQGNITHEAIADFISFLVTNVISLIKNINITQNRIVHIQNSDAEMK